MKQGWIEVEVRKEVDLERYGCREQKKLKTREVNR